MLREKIAHVFASRHFTDAPHTRLFFQRIILESWLRMILLAFVLISGAREAFRLQLPVEDPGVSEDLNTPEDYARWMPKECAESHRLESLPVLALGRTGR